MEKKKIRRIILGIGCLLVLALIVLNIYQYQQANSFSQEINKKPSVEKARPDDPALKQKDAVNRNTTQNASFNAKQKQSDIKDPDNINYQLDTAEEELDMVHNQLPTEQAKKSRIKKLN